MLKDIRLKKGMNKYDVNELIINHIQLEDDMFLGNNNKHNWKCLCGRIIKNRRWADIRGDYSIRCTSCVYEEKENKYKNEVEKSGEYEYIRSFRGGDILPNGRVVKDNPYIQIKHKFCNHIYEYTAVGFIVSKNRCSRCCKTYENSFAHHIEVELGLKLEDIWDFEKNTVNPNHIWRSGTEKVWIKCQEKDYHGSYEISCNKFAAGKRCSYCNPKSSKTVHLYDSFGYHNFDKVQSWHPDNDISPFKIAPNSNKKYKFICNKCGIEWKTSIYSVHSLKTWCPICKTSDGENRIEKFLKDNGVYFIKQYRFSDCKFKRSLPFDFYLPEFNICIEFDGRQHFEVVNDFGGVDGFNEIKIRDSIKNKYCDYNKINLIRIPYWEKEHINEILQIKLIL